ncbi:MAG: metal-dependent amidase/aminoacylase/carboxypeptidase family protein [Candidatus Azotimanducaceae bacterium]
MATLVGEKASSEKGPGESSKRLLLRGDADFLPMPENNDLSFVSEFENKMHARGHDAHTAIPLRQLSINGLIYP